MSLDDIKTYTKYDKAEFSYGIEHMPEQVKIAWEAMKDFKVPRSYKDFDHVVIGGMGGSILGPHMLQSLFAQEAKVAVSLVSDYSLPTFVTKKTLVIFSSASGGTEEVLSMAKDAKKRGAKVAVVTEGGKLLAMAKREQWPYYKMITGSLAPQPRLGLGFSLTGLLGMLTKMKVLSVKDQDIENMMKAMGDVVATCALDVEEKENPAKIVAQECVNRSIMLVGAEHLAGNVHALQNQINETAKQICTYDLVSEINHHRMEGLTRPVGAFKKYTILMVRSGLYHTRVQKRFDITADVFEKIGGRVIDYNCGGGSKLEEVGEMLQFGSFVSYYLGMLNKEDPGKIPYVKWFKAQLGKKK